jgi:hypothetical protein
MQVIVVAHGIEIREVAMGSTLQAFLAANCDRNGPAPPAGANNTWFFPKGAGAKTTHEIRVVYAQSDLAAALDLADAWVVYEGHSRYGQGPAFGPERVTHVPDKTAFPVNPWGVHFRMGYVATDTECIGDLLEHSVVPAEFDLTTADPAGFLPGTLVTAAVNAQAQQKRIKARKTKPADTCSLNGAWRAMDVCAPARATKATARGDKPLAGRHYYVHRDPPKPEEFLAAVQVGSADLDKATLACSVFFMASCSSKVHFHAALVRRRKAAKSACRFLLTAEVCSAEHAKIFLTQVLLKKRNPTSRADMARIVNALNGEWDSGSVGVY